MHRRRNSLRLAGFDYTDPDQVFFVTLCARHLSQPFLDHSLAGQVAESILLRARRNEWRVYAYCLMPDHLHLAMSTEVDSGGLWHVLQGFKSYTTRIGWRYGYKGALWQRSYYEHIARRSEDVLAICQYILWNPVRKGLVTDSSLWPYSAPSYPGVAPSPPPQGGQGRPPLRLGCVP